MKGLTLHTPVTPSGHRRPRAVTLAELVVSMAVMTVVMTGTASVILIAGHALPDAQNPGQALTDSSDLVGQIAGELLYATAISENSATVVAFTVADRGHGATGQETIRYAWSGTPGEPLTRQYNGGTVVQVAQDVQEFDLSYATRSVTTTVTPNNTTYTDVLLASFEGWASVPEPTVLWLQVALTYWTAEFFTINGLPADADNIRITSVFLKMRQSESGNAGPFSVGIHKTVGGGNPGPAPVPIGTPASGSGANLDPSLFLWEKFTFTDVAISKTNNEYVIVVKGTDPVFPNFDADVQRYASTSAPADDTIATWTTDAGSKWLPRANQQDQYDHLFQAYGSYEVTGGGPVDVTSNNLDSVGIKLRVGPVPATAAETEIQVLNAPELPAA